MMRRLVIASPFLVSCSLVLGIEDRHVGTADESVKPDSSTPITGADGGPILTDGGSDGVAPGGRFCTLAPHKACLDFEDGKLGATHLEHAALSIDGPGSSSAGALHAVPEDNQTGRAYLTLPVEDFPRQLTWAFDAFFEKNGYDLECNELVVPEGSGQCRLQPAVEQSKLVVYENCTGLAQVVHALEALAPGAGWYRLNLVVEFGSPFGGQKLTVTTRTPSGGSTTLSFPLSSMFGSNKGIEVHAGLTFSDATKPAQSLRMDNFTLDYQQ